ncbi:MAG: hypothetical protein ACI8P9_003882 [Parasphingorhabdus sp.]|jgi:hypothetical protein
MPLVHNLRDTLLKIVGQNMQYISTAKSDFDRVRTI